MASVDHVEPKPESGIGRVGDSAPPVLVDPGREHWEMTDPRKLSGPELEYTEEAIRHEVEGSMLVRCVITVEGRVEDCRVLQGLPYLDHAAVVALQARCYSPAMLGNRPVDVEYTFRLHFALPQ